MTPTPTPTLPVLTVTYQPKLEPLLALVGEPEGYESPGDGEFSERQSTAMRDSLADTNELLRDAQVVDTAVDF
jgi:hypothetical protein